MNKFLFLFISILLILKKAEAKSSNIVNIDYFDNSLDFQHLVDFNSLGWISDRIDISGYFYSVTIGPSIIKDPGLKLFNKEITIDEFTIPGLSDVVFTLKGIAYFSYRYNHDSSTDYYYMNTTCTIYPKIALTSKGKYKSIDASIKGTILQMNSNVSGRGGSSQFNMNEKSSGGKVIINVTGETDSGKKFDDDYILWETWSNEKHI